MYRISWGSRTSMPPTRAEKDLPERSDARFMAKPCRWIAKRGKMGACGGPRRSSRGRAGRVLRQSQPSACLDG
jgi:hypothetical protein